MTHLIFLAGFLIRYWTVIKSRFGLIYIDIGDSEQNNFLLEWVYRCFSKLDFSGVWSPPIFYPSKGTLTYGDNLFGDFLLYAPFRWIGFGPILSYQFFMMSCSTLNYYATYAVLRKLEVPRLASHLGACFFAFSLPLLQWSGFPNFFPIFPSVLFLYTLFQFIQNPQCRKYLVFSLLALSYQFYCCIGLGLFAVWSAFPLTITAWCYSKASWKKLFNLPNAVLISVLFVVPLFLLMKPYYDISFTTFGPRSWVKDVRDQLPTLTSYLMPADGSIYRPLMPSSWLQRPYAHEHRLFTGLLPLLLFLGGLISFLRHRKITIHPFALAGLVTLACNFLFSLSINGHSLWWFIYRWVPGYSALRGVTKLHMINTFFIGLFLASFWGQHPWLKKKHIFLPLLLFFFIEIQGHPGYRTPGYIEARIQRIAAHISAGEIFFVDSELFPGEDADAVDIDSMWAALDRNALTVNGYGSHTNKILPNLFWLGQITCYRLEQYLLPTLQQENASLSLLYFNPVSEGSHIFECTHRLYERDGVTKLIYPKKDGVH